MKKFVKPVTVMMAGVMLSAALLTACGGTKTETSAVETTAEVTTAAEVTTTAGETEPESIVEDETETKGLSGETAADAEVVRPDGAKPDGAKPEGAKPEGEKPDGARSDGAAPIVEKAADADETVKAAN